MVDEIVRERTEHGKFRSLEDFIDRMSGREVNKRTLESFIKSGAMDGLPGNPQAEVYGLRFRWWIRRIKRRKECDGRADVTLSTLQRKRTRRVSRSHFQMWESIRGKSYLAYEKEMLGVYVSGHPLEEYDRHLWRKM